ncbi:Uncharacterised protein [Vibrio cholerae]|nr:Uncharacterised protein [Vibrio cholerae]CSA48349.1 Uncharacterised protein [Vibrio cholerae]
MPRFLREAACTHRGSSRALDQSACADADPESLALVAQSGSTCHRGCRIVAQATQDAPHPYLHAQALPQRCQDPNHGQLSLLLLLQAWRHGGSVQ